MKKYKIRKLTYEDSAIDDSQNQEILRPAIIEICGFVIEESKNHITMAHEVIYHADGGQCFRGQVAIPKKAIIK